MSILGESPVLTESFLSGKDMEGEGVVVSIAKKYEPIDQKEDTDSRYLTKEENPLVKMMILQPKQVLRYFFFDEQGVEVVFDNASYGFLKELHRLNPDVGQLFRIKRSGEATGTKYHMSFVEASEETVEETVEEEVAF